MSGQLSNCHLSTSNLRESELIAIRAGMFNCTKDQIKMMLFVRPTLIIVILKTIKLYSRFALCLRFLECDYKLLFGYLLSRDKNQVNEKFPRG